MSLDNNLEQRLDKLFVEYRAAHPDLDGSAEFVPSLWAKIEARRNPVVLWAMMSRRVLAGAFALCVLFGLALQTGLTANLFYDTTYIEALDANDEPEDLAQLRPVSYSDRGLPER